MIPGEIIVADTSRIRSTPTPGLETRAVSPSPTQATGPCRSAAIIHFYEVNTALAV